MLCIGLVILIKIDVIFGIIHYAIKIKEDDFYCLFNS
jgi:hypothetical protein